MNRQSQLSTDLSRKGKEVVERYGSRLDLLNTFNPKNVVPYTEDEERCYMGSAPTLTDINLAYGKHTATIWLVAQLNEINKLSGATRGLTPEQLEATAQLLVREAKCLKLTELMLFFAGLRAQKYAQFYGSVDPDKIFLSLRMFKRERGDKISHYEHLQREREREENRSKTISYEEYLKTKNNEKQD